MMVSVGIGGLVLAAMVLGAAAFQNIFYAADDYYQSTAEQMRVMDYIARDLRGALSGSVSGSGQTLTILSQDYLDPATNQPRTPTVKTGSNSYFGLPTADVSYAAATGDSVTIVYTSTSGRINRTKTIVRSGSSSTVSTTIANSIDNFILTDSSTSGTTNFSFGANGQPNMVKSTLSFMPRFNRYNQASSRAGTTVYSTILLRNRN
jgi:hypothetical protein